MKNKLITAVAVLTLGASLAIAAPHEGGRGKWGGKHGARGEFGQKLAQELNLTDAQKAQIKAIKQETRQQNQAFFESARQTMQQFRAAKKAGDTAKADSLKGAVEAARQQMKQIRSEEMQKVQSVLTAEQRTKLESLKSQRRSRRHQAN